MADIKEFTRPITLEEMRRYRLDETNRWVLTLPGEDAVLLPLADDALHPDERATMKDDDLVLQQWLSTMKQLPHPTSVDHSDTQGPVGTQQHRGTCVAFATVSAMEAVLRQGGAAEYDLSEQYAHWVLTRRTGRNACQDGSRTIDAAKYLSTEGICLSPLCPYESYGAIKAHCETPPSAAAMAEAKYRIARYATIGSPPSNGRTIVDTDYLEDLLASGLNIVVGIEVALGDPDGDGVYGVLRDNLGREFRTGLRHAMLIVGYVATAPTPYFICKNSWAPTPASPLGYWKFSYAYLRTYAMYGFVVFEVTAA